VSAVTTTKKKEPSREQQAMPEDPMAALRRDHAWPSAQPSVNGSVEQQGWLGDGTDRLLAGVLTPRTRVVVELGAWLGMSTRYILDHAPNATVISIDHWKGSPEHQQRAEFRALLPALYDTFLSQCWGHRDRIVPLRMSTLEGLKRVAEYGIEPDMIFVDAEHSYPAIMSELDLARELFPRARLVGDDYDWHSVREAVDSFARRNGMTVERSGARGWALVEPQISAGQAEASRWKHRAVVLVPHLGGIDSPCEKGLRDLELAGIRVVRRQGSSQIDLARSEMVSDALHDGFESILFIDADVGFEAEDAIRLLRRPEPVVSAVYAKKGPRDIASIFAPGVTQVVFGPDAPGLYPLKYAATGFLRIRSEVLRQMVTQLKLPLCNTHWGRGLWPFFLSILLPTGEGKVHYLGEDWSFSHRLGLIGVTPQADTSIRLFHYGPFGYSWEEAGSERERFRSYTLSVG
jgi:hypothetical protein